MGIDIIQPNNVPGIISALRWLMCLPEDEGDSDILDKAHVEGFLSTEESLYWRVNEEVVEQALQKDLPFPSDIQLLSSIVHGLGELAARCHGDFMSPLLNQLEEVLTLDDVTKFLDAVANLSREVQPNFNLQERTLAQAIIRSKICWDTYYNTISLMEHRYHFISPKRYGFKFATKIVMHLHPDALCLWISSVGENPALAAITDAAIETLTSEITNNVAMSLMASQNDFLRCLAVASIVCPHGMHSSADLGFTECMESINKAGIPSSDGIWMVGFHLKEFIHEHYRLGERIEGLKTRLQFLKNNPSTATNCLDFEKHEICSHEAQLEMHEKKWVDLQAETEKILIEMAHCWPEHGLSAGQMNDLEHLFVDTAEFRYRLAEKVSHVENRMWLLKRNVDSVLKLIGIGEKLDEILEEYFSFREKHHRDLLFWGARSHVLKWEGDKRGAGRRLGGHIVDFVGRLETLICEPFTISRKPTHWQSAVGRLACAHLFATDVIDNTPKDRQQEIEGLIPIVIEHTRCLLRALMDQWDIHQTPLHDQLAQSAVWLMKHNNLMIARQNWIDDDLLCYPRALALWSNVDSVNKQLDLGKQLFIYVAQKPLRETEYPHYFNRLLTLLDLAVSVCWQAGDTPLLLQIQEIWDAAYLNWEIVFGKQWKDAAKWLIQALSSDGEDRLALLNEPAFCKSYCRALLPSD